MDQSAVTQKIGHSLNKSSVHFRADFDTIAETILTCTAPGPMPVSPASLPFRNLAPGIRLEPLGRSFQPNTANASTGRQSRAKATQDT